MRSPWKLIADLVSRSEPDAPEELESKTVATPDLTAQKVSVQTIRPSWINGTDSPISTQHTGLAPSCSPILPQGDAEQRLPAENSESASSIVLVADSEPVLATTIRLVTKDRSSVLAELAASTAELDTQRCHFDLPVGANIDSYVKPTQVSALLVDEVNVPKERKGQIERIDRSARTQRSPTIARHVRNTKQTSNSRSIPSLAQATPEQVFGSEALQLNEGINDLRHQLAEKLRMQNDYLRRMLARYDAH